MSDPQRQLTGVVIRVDGTVPFEPGCHPEVRSAALEWLSANGHAFESVPGTPHLKIKNWKRQG